MAFVFLKTELVLCILPIQSAFFAPGTFVQNPDVKMRPFRAGDGTHAALNFLDP